MSGSDLSQEWGREIVTQVQTPPKKHFSGGICPCKPRLKVSEDLHVLGCLRTHAPKDMLRRQVGREVTQGVMMDQFLQGQEAFGWFVTLLP